MKIKFMPHDITVDEEKGVNLLAIADINEIYIPHECGGHGSCGTCKVDIKSGLEDLQERTIDGREMAEVRNYQPHERLACQTLIKKEPNGQMIEIFCPAGVKKQKFIISDFKK